MLDRIDIMIFVNSISYKDLSQKKTGESSVDIQKRVKAARDIQKERFKHDKIYCNAQMNQKSILKYCKLDSKCASIIEKIYNKFHISTRAYSRILKVSRTIADLNISTDIEQNDIIEALQYRKFLDDNFI